MRLIDADALLEKCNKDRTSLKFAVLTLILHYAPTIDAEPLKHGEWVHEGFDYMTEQECWSRLPCFCSECKQETKAYFHNYCPNCGAKMDKEKKE